MISIERLHMRAAFIQIVRSYFISNNFLEVDTPVRQPVLIPEANIIPIQSEGAFLQTSPELCMKRLLAQGCERIFQLCSCFRKEERGNLHSEEFTMLEWYRTDADYRELMADCLALLQSVGDGLKEQFPCSIEYINCVDAEYLTVADAFSNYAPCSVWQSLEQDKFDEVLVEYIEPKLGRGRVSFLYDYPAQLASLARKKESNPKLAERFEMYIEGIEIANGFSELTDQNEQETRFEEERKLMLDRGMAVSDMPEKFLDGLSHIDTAAGIALGVDRLLMLLLAQTSIDAVRPFGCEDL